MIFHVQKYVDCAYGSPTDSEKCHMNLHHLRHFFKAVVSLSPWFLEPFVRPKKTQGCSDGEVSVNPSTFEIRDKTKEAAVRCQIGTSKRSPSCVLRAMVASRSPPTKML